MAKKKLQVAVTVNQPFILEKNGKYSGFEIELWEMIAKEMGVKFSYTKHAFKELIPLVASKKADVALGAITITEKREKIVDFSHPTFNSGLRILLSKKRSQIDFAGTIRAFVTQGYKQLIKPGLALLVITILFGHLLWLSERAGTTIDPTYFPGVFQAIWLSLSTILGAGDWNGVYTASTWFGRSVLTLEQLANLAVLGLFIGEVTAFITTRKIRLNIEGPNGLKGKTVATVQGTTSEQVLKDLGATVVPVTKIDEAYEKLKKNKVEAVVFDAPVLLYYSLNEGAEWSEVVGELFDPQDYGVMMQDDSPLRKDVNIAILALRESGAYDELYKKWFS
ncbi:MAG: transporter substrate-binding domain-containing protein [Patescibacteria group bacterium]